MEDVSNGGSQWRDDKVLDLKHIWWETTIQAKHTMLLTHSTITWQYLKIVISDAHVGHIRTLN